MSMKTNPGPASPVYMLPFSPMPGQTHQSYNVGVVAASVFLPPDAKFILVQALTQNIRFTLDGSNPTAAAGFQLLAGDPPLLIMLTETIKLKIIAEIAGARLEYQFGN